MTARRQHGFGSISFTLAGGKVRSRAGSRPARFIKASWASTARLGTARYWHALIMFTLPLLSVPSRAVLVPCLPGFKWQCKRGIRVGVLGLVDDPTAGGCGRAQALPALCRLAKYHVMTMTTRDCRKNSQASIVYSAVKIATVYLLYRLHTNSSRPEMPKKNQKNSATVPPKSTVDRVT